MVCVTQLIDGIPSQKTAVRKRLASDRLQALLNFKLNGRDRYVPYFCYREYFTMKQSLNFIIISSSADISAIHVLRQKLVPRGVRLTSFGITPFKNVASLISRKCHKLTYYLLRMRSWMN